MTCVICGKPLVGQQTAVCSVECRRVRKRQYDHERVLRAV